MPSTRSELAVVGLVAAVQFVNVLDFMIVLPLGPDFARALGIPLSQLGYVGGSYTAAAALAGLIGSLFLDRFDRRKALLGAMVGLGLATALGAAAQGLASMIAARVLAGAFGGPATALSLAIVADVVPPQRRGRAMALVMGSFTVASVLGVPAGLELARLWSWRLPLLLVAGLGFLISLSTFRALPPLRGHLEHRAEGEAGSGFFAVFGQRLPVLSLLLSFALMMSMFVAIPNLAAYLMGNLGYPRARLGLLYFVGGAVSFFGMQAAGRITDRVGAFPVGTIATLAMLGVIWVTFIAPYPGMPVVAVFVGFMFTSSIRSVAFNALISRIPRVEERARFMSMNAAVMHLAASLGAFLSAELLTERAGGILEGMPRVGWVSAGLGMLVPPLLWLVVRGVRSREAEAHARLAVAPALEGGSAAR
ncbi:MAG: MFS transporter [Candidatus Lambdaproteobacteria bacterium]|nr:MFS transporter [Candidatus Lambdaproteobacteria bacterium]